MAGNSQLIDELVSPDAKAQIEDLKKQLSDLGVSFNATAKQAVDFYKATGNASAPSDLTKANKDAVESINKLTETQEKQRLAEIKLQQQREKAFDDYEKKLARQQAAQAKAAVNEAKQQAAREKATAKQIADEQKKADAAAKIASSEEKADQRELASMVKLARQREKDAQAFKQLLFDRDQAREKARNIGATFGADSDIFRSAQKEFEGFQKQVDSINNKLGNFTDNVGNYAGKAFGIIRQIAYILPGIGIAGIFGLLSDGIIKFYQSLTAGETVRTTLNNLERKAADIYASEITNVKLLTAEAQNQNTTSLRRQEIIEDLNKISPTYFGNLKSEQDIVEKLPDDYKRYNEALLQSSRTKAAAMIIEDKYKQILQLQRDIIEGQDTENVDRAGGFAALRELSEAIDQITEPGKKNQIKQLYEQINRLTKEFVSSSQSAGDITGEQLKIQQRQTNEALDYNKQQLQDIVDTNDEIANNEQKSYKARRYALSASLQAQLQILNYSLQQELNTTGLAKDQEKALIDKSNSDALKARRDYNKKLNDLNISAEKQDVEHAKNTVQAQQDAAQVTLSDPNSSLRQRLDALKQYQIKASKLIDIQYKYEKKEAGENEKALTLAKDHETKARLDLEKYYNNEISKLRKEALTDFQATVKLVQQTSESSIQDSLNQQLLDIEQNKAEETLILSQSYKKGEINQQQYNDRIRKLNNQAATQRIQDELDAAQAIYAIRSGLSNASILSGISFGPSAKDVSDAKGKVGQLKTALAGQQAANNVSDTNSDLSDRIKKANEVAQAIGYASTLEQDAQKLINAGYQEQISLLEQKKQAIQDNANIEIAAINDSLESEKSKQQQIALVNARTKAAQDKATAEENKIKRKQAIADKAFNIASIIQNTAVAITKTLAEGGFILGVPLVPVVAGLGAAELAIAAAQPIPAYAKGTGSAKGGLSLVGELGKEFVRTPTGQIFFTPPTPTLMDIPKGSEVLTAMETKRLQNAGVIPKSEKDTALLNEVKRGNDIALKNKPRKPTPIAWPVKESAAWAAYEGRIFR